MGEQETTAADEIRLCAGCDQPVPRVGRHRLFFNSRDVVHDSDECVARRNERLDAKRAQRAAGPDLYAALKDIIDCVGCDIERYGPPGLGDRARAALLKASPGGTKDAG